VYRILGLPMCKFSNVVQFISTAHPHKRDCLLRANIDEEDDGNIFHNSIFTYYEARPNTGTDETKTKEYWDKLTITEFIYGYDMFYGKPSAEDVQNKGLIKLQDKKGFIKVRKTMKTLRY
jgi:hypothetical protein